MNYFTFFIWPAEEGGYWAEVPVLDGCLSQGETMDETIRDIRAAVESHIEALKVEGMQIPEERGVVIGRVAVA